MKITFEVESDKLLEVLKMFKDNLDIKIDSAYKNISGEKICVENILKKPLYKDIPTRPCSILEKHGIHTFGDLVKIKNPSALLEMPGMWRASYSKICEIVESYGLHFGMEVNN